jgi:hypothetical protein
VLDRIDRIAFASNVTATGTTSIAAFLMSHYVTWSIFTASMAVRMRRSEFYCRRSSASRMPNTTLGDLRKMACDLAGRPSSVRISVSE